MAPTAIVTGVSRGIGKAIADRLLEDGYAVVGCARRPGEAAAALAHAGDRAVGVEADVSKAEDAKRLADTALERFGSLEVLVNNAGVYEEVDFLELTGEQWERLMSINVTGAFLCAQAAARAMIQSESEGRIVNIASSTGLLAEPDCAHYNASKAAVISLTRSMASDLAKHGIVTTCVAPGWIDTGIDPALENFSDEELSRLNPLGMAGRPEDVAHAVASLCDPRAGFANGSVLSVDGGQTAVSPVPGG
ncbi:MAG: SDR family oxidoreductase [Solirubrobacterales bacterium]|nr:SDR family oxidoreductase [Solirubrobacterales bacterium]